MYILILAVIISFIIGLVVEMVGPWKNAIPSRRYISKDAGDRLKKYLINASKLNPQNCRTLKIRRTKFNNGGKIGKIVGVIPSKFVTRFIIKKNPLMGLKIIYCPIDMHTNILCRDVIINALGLENASGFYYPHPYKKEIRKKIFDFLQVAFNIDMYNMFIMDMKMINPTQIESAIAGSETPERLIREIPESPQYEKVYPEERGGTP